MSDINFKHNHLINQIQYLPSFEWFVKYLSKSEIAYNVEDSYHKSLHLNRAKISTAQGLQQLIIPLISGRNQKCIVKDLQISYTTKWQREHLNAIKSAYGKAPYFIFYFDEIAEIISKNNLFLVELNLALIEHLVKIMTLKLNSDTIPIPDLYDYDYPQVFKSKNGFIKSCSIIDLLFNCGPDSKKYLVVSSK